MSFLVDDARLPDGNRAHVGISYRYSNKSKYLKLQLDAYGRIELIIPRFSSCDWISLFLNQHQDWITKHLTDFKRNKQQFDHVFEPLPKSIQLCACEKSWETRIDLGPEFSKTTCIEIENVLKIQAPDEDAALYQIRRWLNRKAQLYLQHWLTQWTVQTGLLYESICIRNQKSRWGSCSNKSRISLNQNILFLPESWAKYICLHELCHTRYMNHSKAYWNLVAQYEANYRQIDKALNQHHWYVPLWAFGKKTI